MSLVTTTAQDRDSFCGECQNFIPMGEHSVGHQQKDGSTVHLVHARCAQARAQQENARCSMCAELVHNIADARFE